MGIQYPYLPEGREIKYVPADNQYMQVAKYFALVNSLDRGFPTGVVIVKDNKIIGLGANGSKYHEEHGCERMRLNMPSGQGYELCEGCSPDNHAEPTSIRDAKEKGNETKGADLYLWGHWWACEPCWQKVIKAEIKNLYLMEGSEILFNREHPDNICGRTLDMLVEDNIIN